MTITQSIQHHAPLQRDRNIITIAVALTEGVYVLASPALNLHTAYRHASDAACRIRSAAAALYAESDVYVCWTNLAEVREVIADLSLLPRTARVADCLFWCSTVQMFYRPLRVQGTSNSTLVFGMCRFCDTHRRVGGRYDATQPQPHPARIDGRTGQGGTPCT